MGHPVWAIIYDIIFELLTTNKETTTQCHSPVVNSWCLNTHNAVNVSLVERCHAMSQWQLCWWPCRGSERWARRRGCWRPSSSCPGDWPSPRGSPAQGHSCRCTASWTKGYTDWCPNNSMSCLPGPARSVVPEPAHPAPSLVAEVLGQAVLAWAVTRLCWDTRDSYTPPPLLLGSPGAQLASWRLK